MASEETKRDVFNQLLKMYRNSMALTHEETVILDNDGQDIFGGIERRYAAALPDDLPVIQEAVGDVIVKLKHKEFSLSGAMSYAAVVSLSSWMTFEHEETFARAWVLEAWIVEETGEVVKL